MADATPVTKPSDEAPKPVKGQKAPKLKDAELQAVADEAAREGKKVSVVPGPSEAIRIDH